MTPEEQRIAIAEVCGDFHHDYDSDRQCRDCCMFEREDLYNWCPLKEAKDYLNDLNACHKMEKTLTAGERLQYASLLAHDVSGEQSYDLYFGLLHANAAQRCEAFLKTKGLWKSRRCRGPSFILRRRRC